MPDIVTKDDDCVAGYAQLAVIPEIWQCLKWLDFHNLVYILNKNNDNGGYMTQKSSRESLPVQMQGQLRKLGGNLRIARKRRRLSMEDMAARMSVNRSTLARLEKGEPGVSLSVLAEALWVLNLNEDLADLAAPEKDQVGMFQEQQRLPSRVRKERTEPNLDF